MKSPILLLTVFLFFSCTPELEEVEKLKAQGSPGESFTTGFLCLGKIQNGTLCLEDNLNLKTFVQTTAVNSCSNARKCEYKCDLNYHHFKDDCVRNATIPERISMVAPEVNRGTNATPTVRIFGVVPYESVRIYNSVNCSGKHIGEGQVRNGFSIIDLTIEELTTTGRYTFSTASVKNNIVSECSKATLNYTFESELPSCTDPIANSVLCAGDNMNLITNVKSTIVNQCTSNKKCEHKCSNGFHSFSGQCVSNATIPSGLSNVGPTIGVNKTPNFQVSGVTPKEWVRIYKSNNCTGPYIAQGQVLNGLSLIELTINELTDYGNYTFSTASVKHNIRSSCSPATASYTLSPETFSCNGSFQNASICVGDNLNLPANLSSSLTNLCTRAKKCEYKCINGFHINNGQCKIDATIPSGFRILTPNSGRGENSTPKFHVSGVVPNEWVRIYKSNNCSGNHVAQSKVQNGHTTIDLTISELIGYGSYTFSTASVKHNIVSDCSAATANYIFEEDIEIFECSGSLPANANACYLGNSNPASNLNYTSVGKCTDFSQQNTCKFSCSQGYKYENNQCIVDDLPGENLSEFISIWKLDAGDFIELPLVDGYQYNFIVEWGDGTSNEIKSYDDPAKKHFYANAAEYTVTITGLLEAWDFYPSLDTGQFYIRLPSRNKLIRVENLGDLGWKNLKRAFMGCENLVSFSGGETSRVTDMSFMFMNSSKLKSINLSSFDIKNVTDISYMFAALKELTNLNLSNFDTHNVTNMAGMFHESRKLERLLLSEQFDTSKVTDMSYMFRRTKKLQGVDISTFNTANVTNMDSMLAETPWLTSSAIMNFQTHNVTNMSKLFNGFPHDTLDLSHFDTRKVTNMAFMFMGTHIVTLNLSSFDTSKVKSMGSMFKNSENLSNLIISNTFSILAFGDNVSNSFSNILWNTPSLSDLSYSNILIQFNATTVSESRVMFFPIHPKYSPEAAQARQNLIKRGWSISDGGQSPQ